MNNNLFRVSYGYDEWREWHKEIHGDIRGGDVVRITDDAVSHPLGGNIVTVVNANDNSKYSVAPRTMLFAP